MSTTYISYTPPRGAAHPARRAPTAPCTRPWAIWRHRGEAAGLSRGHRRPAREGQDRPDAALLDEALTRRSRSSPGRRAPWRTSSTTLRARSAARPSGRSAGGSTWPSSRAWRRRRTRARRRLRRLHQDAHQRHAGAYYHYAIATAIKYQLHDHICKKILNADPHSCSYYGHKEVGDFLRSVLRQGATRPLQRRHPDATGEPLSTRAMMEYFKPLDAWLDQQLKGKPVGW